MTTAQVLSLVRRLVDEVDQAASNLTDEELLQFVADTRDELELRLVTGFSSLVVGAELDPPSGGNAYGIVPDPTLEEGYLLALGTALRLLEQAFQGRLNRGELGVAWRSGPEEESSITAAQTYRNMLAERRLRYEAQILVRRAPTAATRIQ